MDTIALAAAQDDLLTEPATAAFQLRVQACGRVELLDGEEEGRALCGVGPQLLAALANGGAVAEFGAAILAVAEREFLSGQAAGRAKLRLELARLLHGD